jgi:hypothetical protein
LWSSGRILVRPEVPSEEGDDLVELLVNIGQDGLFGRSAIGVFLAQLLLGRRHLG